MESKQASPADLEKVTWKDWFESGTKVLSFGFTMMVLSFVMGEMSRPLIINFTSPTVGGEALRAGYSVLLGGGALLVLVGLGFLLTGLVSWARSLKNP